MVRAGHPAEFRRKVLDLPAEGRSVASVAHHVDVRDQTNKKLEPPKTASTVATGPGLNPAERMSTTRWFPVVIATSR